MGKKIPVVVGAYRFATKAEATRFVSEMLDGYSNGERVVGEDEQFLYDLLDLHPEAVEKIACGVSHFTRDRDLRGGRCFWLWRTDGSKTDWSTRKALELKGPRSDLYDALRCEVEAQRNRFLRSQFASGTEVKCAITGQALTEQDAHVDHHDPGFGQIAREFMTAEAIGTLKSMPQLTSDGTRRYLVCRPLAERWQRFHEARAVLRLTTADANLRRKRGPREPGS
jgi:hypothetical protein